MKLTLPPPATVTGRLIANWYVFCDLCPNRYQHSKPRTTSVKEVEGHLRKEGWRYHWHMVMGERVKYWICPKCNEDRARFFKRSRNLREM